MVDPATIAIWKSLGGAKRRSKPSSPRGQAQGADPRVVFAL